MFCQGWFYFHTGDRWFANFWKGKAYGEGRFYSKSGDVIFGHFQDGWRHGDFLCINVDGSRLVFSPIQCLYNKSPHLSLYYYYFYLLTLSLYINFRYIEVWNEGYLMGRENLDSGADTA